jgi:hypothetical protein
MLADWNNNPRVDMSLHITRIPSRPVCSFSLMFRAKRETKNTNFIVFGLIQPGLELTRIHHTRAEHANHHTTDPINVIILTCLCHCISRRTNQRRQWIITTILYLTTSGNYKKKQYFSYIVEVSFIGGRTRVPGGNHWPAPSNWQTVSHNPRGFRDVSATLRFGHSLYLISMDEETECRSLYFSMGY